MPRFSPTLHGTATDHAHNRSLPAPCRRSPAPPRQSAKPMLHAIIFEVQHHVVRQRAANDLLIRPVAVADVEAVEGSRAAHVHFSLFEQPTVGCAHLSRIQRPAASRCARQARQSSLLRQAVAARSGADGAALRSRHGARKRERRARTPRPEISRPDIPRPVGSHACGVYRESASQGQSTTRPQGQSTPTKEEGRPVGRPSGTALRPRSNAYVR